MEKYLISDEEFEHIGIEFNLARNLVRYLQLVDKRTRKIILEELYNRESKPDIPYNLGKVSFKYFKVENNCSTGAVEIGNKIENNESLPMFLYSFIFSI